MSKIINSNEIAKASFATKITTKMLDRAVCERARRSRDPRFDGQFFIAVKTTGIFCRPICPARQPLEKNVDYYLTAIAASQAGFRPCLRCRPDSAPHSYFWDGTQSTVKQALRLIQQGILQEQSIEYLADQLEVSSRYLRTIFTRDIGVSPKQYAIYQQCLFAKQLLHESSLSVTQVAFASGFNSIRRFNEALQERLSLSPTDIRKQQKKSDSVIELKLHYRPPYAWDHCFNFLKLRLVDGVEWVEERTYYRTIDYQDTQGYFSVTNDHSQNCLIVKVCLEKVCNLLPLVQSIRQLFDVDASINEIDNQLNGLFGETLEYLPGMRVPGVYGVFEAGVRAVLGQQVTVVQAKKMVERIVLELGENITIANGEKRKIFPKPGDVVSHDLSFLHMPEARKNSLRALAKHILTSARPNDIEAWLDLKGIGPWTVNYVKLRSSKDPDVWLAGDAGIKNALKYSNVDWQRARPWRSYLTLQLWNQLSLNKSN